MTGFLYYSSCCVVLQVGYFWVTLVVMCVTYTGIYRVALDLQRKSEAKHRQMTNAVTSGQRQSQRQQDASTVQHTEKTRLSAAFAGNSSQHLACAESSSPLKPSSSRTTDKDDRSSSPALPSDNDTAAASRANGANSKQQQQQQLVASTEGCYIYVGEVDNEQQSPVAKIVVKASSDNNDCSNKNTTQESTNRLTVAKSTLRLSLTSLESMSCGFRRRSQKTCQGKSSSRQGSSKKSKPKKNSATSRKGIGLMLRAGKVAGKKKLLVATTSVPRVFSGPEVFLVLWGASGLWSAFWSIEAFLEPGVFPGP